MVQCLIAGMIMPAIRHCTIFALEPPRSIHAAMFEAARAGSLQHTITGTLTVDDRGATAP
jgi:hypothetical protein